MDIIASRYTVVFSQVFSPCGNFLITGSNYGYITVFSLQSALSPNADSKSWIPYYSFKAVENEIYCLCEAEDVLICGGSSSVIRAWKISDILNKAPKCIWTLTIPPSRSVEVTEVNALAVNYLEQESSSEVVCGAGDNNVYVWDLEAGQMKMKLCGHRDYVHDVKVRRRGAEYASASEDGSVRVWDSRTKEAVHILEPFRQEACVRSKYGKWIGCLDIDESDDWLVCGGGPKMSLWHMRSLAPVAMFDTPNSCQLHVQFFEDSVISAGTEAKVHHWFKNGDRKSNVPCKPSTVFNVSINDRNSSNKVLTVAGSGPYIDVCTNFSYTAFQLYNAT